MKAKTEAKYHDVEVGDTVYYDAHSTHSGTLVHKSMTAGKYPYEYYTIQFDDGSVAVEHTVYLDPPLRTWPEISAPFNFVRFTEGGEGIRTGEIYLRTMDAFLAVTKDYSGFAIDSVVGTASKSLDCEVVRPTGWEVVDG